MTSNLIFYFFICKSLFYSVKKKKKSERQRIKKMKNLVCLKYKIKLKLRNKNVTVHYFEELFFIRSRACIPFFIFINFVKSTNKPEQE